MGWEVSPQKAQRAERGQRGTGFIRRRSNPGQWQDAPPHLGPCIPKSLEREWGDYEYECEYEYEFLGTRGATPPTRQQLRDVSPPAFPGSMGLTDYLGCGFIV